MTQDQTQGKEFQLLPTAGRIGPLPHFALECVVRMTNIFAPVFFLLLLVE